jgi:hypothetical protein
MSQCDRSTSVIEYLNLGHFSILLTQDKGQLIFGVVPIGHIPGWTFRIGR